MSSQERHETVALNGKAVRRNLSKSLRFDILKRDGFRCQYCGKPPSETVILEVDHVHPIADGGTSEIDNLVTSCFDCNRGKSATILSFPPRTVDGPETEIKPPPEILNAHKTRKNEELWSIALVYMDWCGLDTISRSKLSMISYFLEYLEYSEVLNAMRRARNFELDYADIYEHAFKCFHYLCGIKKDEQKQEQRFE